MSKETDGLDELLCWNVKRAERAEEQVAQLKQENQQLKEQLENAIVPKFKVGDKVYQLVTDENTGGWTIHEDCITDIGYQANRLCYFTNYWGSNIPFGHKENELFTTQQEAEMKLKELKNE